MRSLLLKFIKVCPKTGRFRGFRKTTGLAKLLFPVMGIAAIVWILIRVIPKPSRAEYPCMKVAAPIASGFIIYVGGLAAAVFSFKKAKAHFKNSRFGYAILFAVAALAVGSFSALKSDNDYKAESKLLVDSVFVPSDSANHPIGTAKGIFPGRVVWDYNPAATRWNGSTSTAWWSEQNTIQDSVTSMLSKSILTLTGKSSDADAWDALFRYYNSTHNRGSVGYTKGEKVIVKINLNWSSDGTGTMANNCPISSPQMIYAMIKQLVSNAGVQPADITIYDLIRYLPTPIYNKLKTEFAGMHFMGFIAGPGRELYVRDSTNQIHWSQKLTLEKDPAFSAKGGNPAYLATAVTQAKYMINLAYMKGHRFAGVSLCAKSHVGSLSVDDDNGKPEIWAPHAAGIHAYYSVHYVPASLTWGLAFEERKMGSYNTIVDLMGHKDLGGKTILYLVDGLYGVENEQAAVSSTSKWQMAPFNNSWTSTMLVSQDPVALESVGVDFYRTEEALNKNFTFTYGNVDNYLHEAALANNPPSGTFYAPNGDGVRLQSLGVHEHWNNANDKLYSRNLDPVNGKGIELVKLASTVTSVQEVNSTPSGYGISQNYPNPFNPTTMIRYQIPREGFVTIKLYDALGKEIKTLVSSHQTAGIYNCNVDASKLSSGVYIYKISVNNFTQSKKMVLIR